jgi:hypothetical protein
MYVYAAMVDDPIPPASRRRRFFSKTPKLAPTVEKRSRATME